MKQWTIFWTVAIYGRGIYDRHVSYTTKRELHDAKKRIRAMARANGEVITAWAIREQI